MAFGMKEMGPKGRKLTFQTLIFSSLDLLHTSSRRLDVIGLIPLYNLPAVLPSPDLCAKRSA